MVQADELQTMTSALAIWHAYDPASLAELFSTVIQLKDRLFLVDPISLASAPRQELDALGKICGVFLTNVNHLRAAKNFAEDGAMILSSARTASAHSACEILAIFA